MFIKFEGRLINTDEFQYATKSTSFNSFGVDIYLKNNSRIIEILYKNETDRDNSFYDLQNMLVPK